MCDRKLTIECSCLPCLMFLPGVTLIDSVELSPRSQRVDKDHVPDFKSQKDFYVELKWWPYSDVGKNIRSILRCSGTALLVSTKLQSRLPSLLFSMDEGWTRGQLSSPYSLIAVPLCASVNIRNMAQTARLCSSYYCSSWILKWNIFDLVDIRKLWAFKCFVKTCLPCSMLSLHAVEDKWFLQCPGLSCTWFCHVDSMVLFLKRTHNELCLVVYVWC